MESFKAIRGAVQITENSREAISFGVTELYQEIISRNSLEESQLISLIISQTRDLDAFNAATAIRLGCRATEVPLFCTQECHIEGGMPRVIRFLFHVTIDNSLIIEHVYIHGAENLRHDRK